MKIAKYHRIISVLLAAIFLFAAAGCNLNQNPDSPSDSEMLVSAKQFEYFHDDFTAVKDFIKEHSEELLANNPTAIYHGYDEEGCYFYTNDNQETVYLNPEVRESFENIHVLIGANGGYGFINNYSDKTVFEFSDGAHGIACFEDGKARTITYPSGGEYSGLKYSDNWYYMSAQ